LGDDRHIGQQVDKTVLVIVPMLHILRQAGVAVNFEYTFYGLQRLFDCERMMDLEPERKVSTSKQSGGNNKFFRR
jgi:hypothetical protein